MCHHGGCVCSMCYDAEVANESQIRWRHAQNVRGSSYQVVLAFEFWPIPPFSGFHVSSAREEWAWVTGQLQFMSHWLWMIVNKVELITDGCQLWSHFLPGADGSHFGSPLKLWHRRPPHMWISRRLARVIVITCRVGSFVSNVSINRQSPAVPFLYPRGYIFMKSGPFVWTFATDYMRSSHSKLGVQMCSYISRKSVIIQLPGSLFLEE